MKEISKYLKTYVVRNLILWITNKNFTVKIKVAAYLADVFEDLGTTKIPDFVNMRQMFFNAGYLES